MPYAAANFEAATSKGLGGDAFTEKNTLFDLDLGVKVTCDVSKYPLHHVTYSDTKFEVSTYGCVGGDALIKNVII